MRKCEKNRKRLMTIFNFSLIELLVVIAIIAILTSILLPALRMAKEKTKEIGCVANMKQLYLGFEGYRSDWNEWYPQCAMQDTDDPYDIQIADHIGYNHSGASTGWGPAIYHCPSGVPCAYTSNLGRSSGYFMNRYVATNYDDVMGRPNHAKLSETSLLFDGFMEAWGTETMVDYEPNNTYIWISREKNLKYRHNSRVNVLTKGGTVHNRKPWVTMFPADTVYLVLADGRWFINNAWEP